MTVTPAQRLERAIRRHEQIMHAQTLLDELRAEVLAELHKARAAAYEATPEREPEPTR